MLFRRFLVLFVGLGIVFQLAWFFSLSQESFPRLSDADTALFVKYGAGFPSPRVKDSEDLADLLDSEPLFMPTKWNSSNRLDQVARLSQITEVFSAIPAPVDIPEFLSTSTPPTDSLAAVDLLADDPGLFMSLFGRLFKEEPQLQSETPPKILVTNLSHAIPSALQDVPVELPPGQPKNLWSPFTAFFHVQNKAIIGSPLIENRTGSSDWDQVLFLYLSSPDFILKFPDGYFRIQVFP